MMQDTRNKDMSFIDQNTLPINGSTKYRKTQDGNYIVNRRNGRRLKRHWTDKGYYSMIILDNGRRMQFYHDWKAIPSQSREDAPTDARPIPDYPDYLITEQGGVWRAPAQRNERPRLLAEHERHGRRYVQIKDKNGKRHNKRIDRLVDAVFNVPMWEEDF